MSDVRAIDEFKRFADACRERGIVRAKLGDMELELAPRAPEYHGLDELRENEPSAPTGDDGRYDHSGLRPKRNTAGAN